MLLQNSSVPSFELSSTTMHSMFAYDCPKTLAIAPLSKCNLLWVVMTAETSDIVLMSL